MAKVKRKQIEYEGSITQFIRGDGSLDDIDNLKDALLLEYDMYTRVMSGATPEEIYAANNNKRPVIAILKTEDQYNKTIGTYRLVQADYSVSREKYIFHFLMIRPTTSGSIPFGYIYFDGSQWSAYSGYLQRQLVSNGPYQNIKTINNQSLLGTGNIEITFQDTNTQYLLDIETQNQTVNAATIKKYIIKLKDKDTEEVVSSVTVPIWGTRTINGENIIQKAYAGGDINLHDGYYFPNAAQDNDGNWYGAVVIGNQVWLGENYRSKTFRDGTAIQHYEQGLDPSIPWYYDGPESEDGLKKHGLSYNWAAISKTTNGSNSELIQQLTIDGWHIPTDDDFIELFNYTGDQTRYNSIGLASNIHLFASVEEWAVNNVSPFGPVQLAKLNATGFSAYPTIGTSYCRFMTTTVSDGTYVSYLCNLEDSSNTQFHKVTWASAPTQMWVRLLCDKTPAEFRAWYVAQYGSMQHHLPQEIPTIPTPFFYGYTNTVESTPTKVVTLAEPTTGFKNGTYIMVYFAGGSVPAGNDNAISIGTDVYYLAYKAQGITQAGVINQGDKVLLWCHNGFAHVISNDRWSLPTITAADEGKILKVVNGALALVNP